MSYDYSKDFEWAEKRLDELGSADDPIWFQGKETSFRQLSYDHYSLDPIKGIKITYFGGSPLRKIKGTIGGMIRERARSR